MHRLIVRCCALFLLLAAGLAHAAPVLELDVMLDPAQGGLRAEATLTPDGRDVRFLLHESLRIESVAHDGKPRSFDSSSGPAGYREWRIRLNSKGERISIRYAGKLPPLDTGRDHRSVLLRLPPMSSPAGSFLPSGSAWYPQVTELISYRVRLSLPGDQRALVAGRRVAETLPTKAGDRYVASYEFLQPTDGIDLMAGPWVVRARTVDRENGQKIALRTYFSAELDATPGLATAYLDDTARYISRYSKEVGDYPYTEFSIVTGPLPTGFGMPTLTYLGEAVVRLPFIRQTSLGHEILHNWWGNGVYVDYARGNWSEGLTTFMADYTYKTELSPAAAAEMRLAWRRDALATSARQQPSLRTFRSRTHGAEAAIGYGKSAMLFVMLRDRIGEAAFAEGIREFWRSNRFKVADWGDLQAAFERVSGQALGGFFAGWLDQHGLPAIAITQPESRAQGKQYEITLSVVQDKPAIPLRLPVELMGEKHRETRWVSVDAAQTTLRLKLDFPPKTLRLDPDFRVWRQLEARSLPPILRQWISAPAPQVVNVARDKEANLAVDALNKRFFERPATSIPPGRLINALHSEAPVLLAGTSAEVDQALHAANLPPRPVQVSGKGNAQVWTLPAGTAGFNAPLAIISADNAGALLALQRGLPHYGSQSWLVFESGRVIDKGIWPANLPSVPVIAR